MAVRVSRPLTYSNRFGKQQATHGGMFQLHQIAFADRAIQGDPIRALVELITNCDDAYNKRASDEQAKSGPIEISVTTGHGFPYLSIRDRAVGIDGQRLDEALGSYTSATSGEADRGYFGRGLKDGILALGDGEVESVLDHALHKAWLGIRHGYPYYEAQHPVPASRAGDDGRAPKGGTTVRIKVNRPDVTPPTFQNLERQIPLHFMLRSILSNPARAVVLTELSAGGETLRQKRLFYRYPPARLVLDNSLRLNRFEIPYRITVYEADNDLSTPRDAGPYAEAGILITDGNAILDNTLGRFDADPDAAVFFGRLECPHINTLMRNNEAIVQATRQGLVWGHEVARELRLTLDERLEPLVQDRARQGAALRRARGRESLKVRLGKTVAALNDIARSELCSQKILLRRIVFDDAHQDAPRARFDRRSGDIVISTAHSSISQYVSGDAKDGIRSPQGQVLLAELVLQAFCGEIAARQADGGERGPEERALRLRDAYSARVHGILVERRFRMGERDV